VTETERRLKGSLKLGPAAPKEGPRREGRRRPGRSRLGADRSRAAAGDSRRASARSVNAVMTAAYREVGRRIVEGEQSGGRRAGYGKELLKRLASDLTARFGRGFSRRNFGQRRLSYPGWRIPQTVSAKSHPAKALSISRPAVARRFPLPWSHYAPRKRTRQGRQSLSRASSA
jgi:hypothetical protein